MQKGKPAILVNYKEEKVRCIYDASERVFVDYPNTKTNVTVYSTTLADIKRNLRKLKLFTSGSLNKNGFLFLLSGLNPSEWTADNIKAKMLAAGYIDSSYKLTSNGVKFIKANMTEKLTSIEGGDLALNEEGKETKLVKFVL
jgi:hypothetical protein